MKKAVSKPETIDDYIAGFAPETQKILKRIRTAIRKAAPAAEEAIKYQMPTFVLDGNLVFFAVFKHHIGFYPGVKGPASLKRELAAYQGTKGSFRFALDEPVPLDLIGKIVRQRIEENSAAAAAKRRGRVRGGAA